MNAPTEGVAARIREPFLKRCLPRPEEAENYNLGQTVFTGVYNADLPIVQEGLELKISLNSYKLWFGSNSMDVLIMSARQRERYAQDETQMKEKRAQKFRRWESSLQDEEKTSTFRKWLNGPDVEMSGV